jgi:hypothetical protein
MASKGARILFGAILLGGITAIVFQQRTIGRLREQREQLDRELATAVQQPSSFPSASFVDSNEWARLRAQEKELIRLRGEVTMLRREREALSNQLTVVKAKSATTSTNIIAPAPLQNVDTAWVQQMLNAPLNQQGLTAGALRGKFLRGEGSNIVSSEIAFRDALLQRQLNQILERTPVQFADFQTAFIQGAVGISDPNKLQQIHDLIRQTYEQAVANGLDIPSKPIADSDAWVQQRFQLDRRATAAVEQILTPEESQLFGRAFIGVMGVDLGSGGVDKSNYPKRFLGSE